MDASGSWLRFAEDSSNTFRSFFGTNILSMSWSIAILGIGLGPLITLIVALFVYRSIISLIRVKQSYDDHEFLVSYGAVVARTLGWQGRVVVDCLVMFCQFATCVSYTTFASHNIHGLTGLPYVWAVVLVVLCTIGVSVFHTPMLLARISLVTNSCMFLGAAMIISSFRFADSTKVDYWRWNGMGIGAATLASSLGGITTVLDVERTMVDRPGQYLRFLRVILPIAVMVLLLVGTAGYLSFGRKTCSVLSLSVPHDTWQHRGSEAVLSVGPVLESVVNSFPLFVLMERNFRENIPFPSFQRLAIRRATEFFILQRIVIFIAIGFLAYGVPFFGLIAAVNGAVGYASLSFVLPPLIEWARMNNILSRKDKEEENGSENDNKAATSPTPPPSPQPPAILQSSVNSQSARSETDGLFVRYRAAQQNSGLVETVDDDPSRISATTWSPGVPMKRAPSDGNLNSSMARPSTPPLLESSSILSNSILPSEAYVSLLQKRRYWMKFELIIVFFFGVAIVIGGTIFALMKIAEELHHTDNGGKNGNAGC